MKLSTSITTVTTFSKFLALVLFIVFPVVGFYLGMQYQNAMTDTQDLRLRLFTTQEACESFTERVCRPTICERNPSHDSCSANNQTGWFATRQEISEASDEAKPVEAGS